MIYSVSDQSRHMTRLKHTRSCDVLRRHTHAQINLVTTVLVC